MNNRIKQFIESIIDSIDKNQWDVIYTCMHNYTYSPTERGTFTSLMHEAGIYPEVYLNFIPSAFLYNSSITFYELGDNHNYIGAQAFAKCEDLCAIHITKACKKIQSNAFYGCHNLRDIYYDGTKTEWIKLIQNAPPSWDSGTPEYVVHCSDERILKIKIN